MGQDKQLLNSQNLGNNVNSNQSTAILEPKFIKRLSKEYCEFQGSNYSREEELKMEQDNLLPLAKHPRVSRKLKLIIPSLLLLNAFMFLYCNIATGALVQAGLTIMGFQSPHFNVSDFTLYGSVSDMWKAGVEPLAIVILLFSGIWPYIKIGGMCCAWFLSQQKLSFQKREKFLQILDVMGKWSLIDSYFMIIMIVAFKLLIDLKVMGIKIAFDITVTPLFDFYCFVMATMMSLILTHIIIHQHRHTIDKIKDDEEDNKEQFMEEKVAFGQISRFQKIFVPILTITGLLVTVTAYFMKIFTFTFEGLAGWALGADAVNSYSLYDIGVLLPLKTYEPDSFGIRCLQILYFVFTLLVPVAFLIIICLFFLVPMKLRVQKNLFVYAEILYAWSSIDVFALAMVSSLFEIRQFAQFMIGSKCEGINQIIEQLVQVFPEVFDLAGNNTCFDLVTSLGIGSSVLFTSSVLIIIVGSQSLRYIQKELESRLEQGGQRKISTVSRNVSRIQSLNNSKIQTNENNSKDLEQQLLQSDIIQEPLLKNQEEQGQK